MLQPPDHRPAGPARAGTSVYFRSLPLLSMLVISLLMPACGQKDPIDINGPGNGQTPPGSLAVLANVAGAAVFLSGMPTAYATSDTLTGLEPGTYGVTVALEGYTASPGSVTVTVASESLSTAEFDLSEIVTLTRTILVENFTNWNCPNCPNAEEKLEALTQEFPPDRVVRIAYHDYYASRADPYYRANEEESDARLAYYSVLYNPIVFLDGIEFNPGVHWSSLEAYDLLRSAVLSRLAVAPALEIVATVELDGDSLRVEIGITAHADFSGGGLALHCVVVETQIIPDEIGPQGQTEYLFVMRDMIPDAGGEALAINDRQTLTFQRATAIDPAWDTAHLAAVVFVQRNDGSHEVLQAAGTY